MEETGAAIPLQPNSVQAAPPRAYAIPRWLAAIQAVLVSGIPTGLIVAAGLILTTDLTPFGDQGLTLEFMATVTLLDTALIALLIRVFLEMSGEDSRTVFLGKRPVLGEVLRGVALIPVVFLGVTAIALLLRVIAPGLHTVQENPMAEYMRTPFDAAVFLLVVMLGGGVREELQRAFILHRFEQALGGVRIGLVVFSLLFGALHVNQGVDTAIAIGALGMFWGVLYIRRRSAMMGLVNHAGFNAAQVVQVMLVRALGGN